LLAVFILEAAAHEHKALKEEITLEKATLKSKRHAAAEGFVFDTKVRKRRLLFSKKVQCAWEVFKKPSSYHRCIGQLQPGAEFYCSDSTEHPGWLCLERPSNEHYISGASFEGWTRQIFRGVCLFLCTNTDKEGALVA
jgi:hypothetical protein